MARKLRPYAQIYATAAKKIGLRVVRINDQTVDILHKKNRIRFFYAMCSKNDSVSAAISRYKFATNAVLKAANLPVFEQQVFNRESKKEINAFIKKIKLPVVVKPADSFQGDGITVNITSLAAVHEAVDIAHRYSRRIIIEKYYKGEDYRILIAHGKILAATLRLPARVVGDGVHTIEELITSANKKLPKKIKIDPEVKNRLLEQDMTMHTIPVPKEVVYLRYRANAALGGTTVNLDVRHVHPDNLKACVRAVKTLGLELAGVDLMTSDITQSYKKTKGAITEINDNPAIDIHSSATLNPIPDITERVLAALFEIPYRPLVRKYLS